jgi:hypothetical protein
MKPINHLVSPVLTDLYQLITMAYGYWKSGRENDRLKDIVIHHSGNGEVIQEY